MCVRYFFFKYLNILSIFHTAITNTAVKSIWSLDTYIGRNTRMRKINTPYLDDTLTYDRNTKFTKKKKKIGKKKYNIYCAQQWILKYKMSLGLFGSIFYLIFWNIINIASKKYLENILYFFKWTPTLNTYLIYGIKRQYIIFPR